MFDRGCREGWLARELNARKIDVVGLDGTAQLVEAGRQGGSEFRLISYEDIAAGRFALLGKDPVGSL